MATNVSRWVVSNKLTSKSIGELNSWNVKHLFPPTLVPFHTLVQIRSPRQKGHFLLEVAFV